MEAFLEHLGVSVNRCESLSATVAWTQLIQWNDNAYICFRKIEDRPMTAWASSPPNSNNSNSSSSNNNNNNSLKTFPSSSCSKILLYRLLFLLVVRQDTALFILPNAVINRALLMRFRHKEIGLKFVAAQKFFRSTFHPSPTTVAPPTTVISRYPLFGTAQSVSAKTPN